MKKVITTRFTRNIIIGILCMVFLPIFSSQPQSPDWGFFGHRKINRMAVFTLPPEMIQFYKKNIEYITEHSIDPDKRRYATKHEAVRHYIDIDSWGENPFFDVPRIFEDALIKYSKYSLLNGGDTSLVALTYARDSVLFTSKESSVKCSTDSLRVFFREKVMPNYYEDDWKIESEVLDSILPGFSQGAQLIIKDEFSKEGILPYHLNQMYYWLVKAFEEQNLERILRLSAEFGHYIGDAHVPLHTTKNYNGQLTDQVGIHAFWESRIPELFADSEYSFLVGKAEKIDQPLTYFWNIIKDSHDLLDDVLRIEKELRLSFPEDQQLCFDERLNNTLKIQCPEFARAYQDQMSGMVEDRMQDAILSIGSVWYSAWIDAGQPNLNLLENKLELEAEKIVEDPNISTREHGS